MSQAVISNDGRGGRRKLPMVFAEQGVPMLDFFCRQTNSHAKYFRLGGSASHFQTDGIILFVDATPAVNMKLDC
jgi:hypothetical protein